MTQSLIGPFGGFLKTKLRSSSLLTELVVEVREDLESVGEFLLFSFTAGENPFGLVMNLFISVRVSSFLLFSSRSSSFLLFSLLYYFFNYIIVIFYPNLAKPQ